MTFDDFLKAIKAIIEEFAPTLAVILWNYEEAKVDEAKNETLDANLKLELEKNNETINSKYVNSSDLDVIDDAIGKGSGGQSEGDSPASSTTASGDSKK